MGSRLEEFKRGSDYLICIDSDGCAMDTMDIKHYRCFGPCMVAEWSLELKAVRTLGSDRYSFSQLKS